jgi:23S rRNA maturation-related 3'-5' exoribonuclease YhaM
MKSSTNCIQEYETLLNQVVERREAVEKFDRFLRDKTAWLTSPASTRFHLAEDGGLLRHSVNVAQTLLKLRDTLAPDLSAESCVIVGLFHDLGKVGMPGKPYYLPNPSEWHVRNRGIRYIVNQDIVHMDIATRSLFIIAQHMQLSDDEAQAIRYHDGQYIAENQSVAHQETRLTRLLQYADNWAGGVLESETAQESGSL